MEKSVEKSDFWSKFDSVKKCFSTDLRVLIKNQQKIFPRLKIFPGKYEKINLIIIIELKLFF